MEYVKYMGLTSSDYLFMGNQKWKTYKGKTDPIIYPVTRQLMAYMIKKVVEGVGIDFTFGLHSLRKTFGYMYMKNGGNLLTLQKMYNHDSPATTLIYVEWGKEDAEHDREGIYIGGIKSKKTWK